MPREGWQWHPFALAKDITDSPTRLAFGRRGTPKIKKPMCLQSNKTLSLFPK